MPADKKSLVDGLSIGWGRLCVNKKSVAKYGQIFSRMDEFITQVLLTQGETIKPIVMFGRMIGRGFAEMKKAGPLLTLLCGKREPARHLLRSG
jgi:hypothetical protein